MDKKRIVFGLIGMALSVVLFREAALAYMKTWDGLLIMLMIMFVFSFSCGLVTMLEGTPLAAKAAGLFDERKEAGHE